MEVKDILHMTAGDGETSYANNSGLQKVVLSKTWPVLDQTFKHMFNDSNNGFPTCIRLADLGCSSGPNTIFLISHVINTIQHLCRNNCNNLTDLPQLEVLLNDLPHNDFNNLFRLMSDFSSKEKSLKCSIYGAPGSFYATLFPSNSIHFVYSSFSIHWLSQVPEGLGNNNSENIYIADNSPPQACEAYANQFKRDFSKFLSLRAEELTSSGRMVLSLIGRSVTRPFSIAEHSFYAMLAESLLDMVTRGMIKKDDLYSFNLPVYTPCLQEIEAIVCDEGSFSLDIIEGVSVPWAAQENDKEEVFDEKKNAELVANCLRAVMEPLFVGHFGGSIIDGVFDILEEKMTEHYLSKEMRSSYFIPLVSLTRKPR